MAETTEFVREHELVSLVDDPCVIQEMPEFARGVAVAYCDPPGPAGDGRRAHVLLHRAHAGGLVARAGGVVLPRVQRPHDPQPDRARGDARALPAAGPRPPVPRLAPGSARSAGPARSSRAGRSTPRRSWPSAGFGGLPVRLQQLKMQLRMTINAILDQLVHCEDMTEGEAMALMTGRGLPGGGRGGRQVAPRAAHLDPAVDLLRGIHRGRGDRGRPPGRGLRRWPGTTRCSATARPRPGTCAAC